MNRGAEPVCFRCHRAPGQIEEYVFNPNDDPDPVRFVVEEEGTYDRKSGLFCCTECYVDIGMPSRDLRDPRGRWRPLAKMRPAVEKPVFKGRT